MIQTWKYLCEDHYHCKMEFGHAHLLIMFTVICVVSSDIQSLELTDKIDELEIIIFGENPCQNCTVEL